MSEFPKQFTFPDTLVHISSYSPNSTMFGLSGFQAGGSATWPTANLALYVPFRLAKPTVISSAFFESGAAASGNFDIGVYSADGTKIVSTGSTANAVTSGFKTVSLSSTELGAGLFYLALAINNTTQAVLRSSPALTTLATLGWAQQASAFPLPATATMATVLGGSLFACNFGVTGRSFV